MKSRRMEEEKWSQNKDGVALDYSAPCSFWTHFTTFSFSLSKAREFKIFEAEHSLESTTKKCTVHEELLISDLENCFSPWNSTHIKANLRNRYCCCLKVDSKRFSRSWACPTTDRQVLTIMLRSRLALCADVVLPESDLGNEIPLNESLLETPRTSRMKLMLTQKESAGLEMLFVTDKIQHLCTHFLLFCFTHYHWALEWIHDPHFEEDLNTSRWLKPTVVSLRSLPV